jgi:hypothetical protein
MFRTRHIAANIGAAAVALGALAVGGHVGALGAA